MYRNSFAKSVATHSCNGGTTLGYHRYRCSIYLDSPFMFGHSVVLSLKVCAEPKMKHPIGSFSDDICCYCILGIRIRLSCEVTTLMVDLLQLWR